MAVLTYAGNYGEVPAGTNGLTTTLTAPNALPAGAIISEIQYSLNLRAAGYSLDLDWRLYFISVLGGTQISGNPYATSQMTSTYKTWGGQLPVGSAAAFATNSISVSAKANCEGKWTTYMKEVSITIIYTLPPPASTGVLSATNVDAGNAIGIDLSNPNMASVTHQLLWSIGAYNSTQNLAQGVDESEFTIPLAWLSAMPASPVGAATVRVTTYYNGVSAGYNTYSFNILAGSGIVPVISAFTAERVDGVVPEGWGIYIQGKSKVRLQTTAAGVYGSTIVSYSVTGDGYTGILADYTTGFINGTGSKTYTVVVTDTRGKVASDTVTITVYAYAAPAIILMGVVRCIADGTETVDGTYGKAKGTPYIASCNGNNAVAAYEIYYKLTTAEEYTLVEDEAESNTWYLFGAGALDETKTYHVKFVIEDAFGETNIIVTLAAALFTIFLRNGGRAVGFGVMPTKDDEVVINPAWEFSAGGAQILAPLVFTFTLDKDDWTGTGPYYQTVSVTGMLAAYVNNKIDVDLSATEATMIDQLESWLYVLDGDIKPDDGEINAICLNDEPTVDLPVRMVVFR